MFVSSKKQRSILKSNHSTKGSFSKSGIFFPVLVAALLLGSNNSFRVQASVLNEQTTVHKSQQEAAESWRNEAMEYLSTDIETAQKLSREALRKADRQGDEILKMHAFYVLGLPNNSTTVLKKRISCTDKVLPIIIWAKP